MPLLAFEGHEPSLADDVFIAPGSRIIGRVAIGAKASIWYNCVLRGDVESITVGPGTNIQDGTIVHVTTGLYATNIGSDCLIGHQAIVHGCTLEDRSFVGLGAIVMDGCVIEPDAMLAAGALLAPGKRMGRGQLWAGRPAKYMRDLRPEELMRNRSAVLGYQALARRHVATLSGSLTK